VADLGGFRWAFLAISLMLAPISWPRWRTVCGSGLTCSAAEETTFAVRSFSELAVICWLVLESSSLAPANLHRRGSDGLDHLAAGVFFMAFKPSRRGPISS